MPIAAADGGVPIGRFAILAVSGIIPEAVILHSDQKIYWEFGVCCGGA